MEDFVNPMFPKCYFFINTDGQVMFAFNHNQPIDNMRISFGNCFPTRETAEAMAAKVTKVLKEEL